MIKQLLQVGFFVTTFAAASAWATPIYIDDASAGSNDGADVGLLDTFIAEDDFAGNPAAETDWVNSILAGMGISVTFEVKTEDVGYFRTNTTDVYALGLATDVDYFLVKNSTRMALFENLEDMDWGVFDATDLSDGMHIGGDDFVVSHVTQFSADGGTPTPEPTMVALLAIGLIGMTVARRKLKA